MGGIARTIKFAVSTISLIGHTSRLFGDTLRLDPRMPRQLGYVFVVLGAGLVALSLTTLVLLNSCRYMRLI